MTGWPTRIMRLGAMIPLAVTASTCSAAQLHHAVAKAPVQHSTGARHRIVHGADISWPNCPKGEGIKHRRTKNEPMPGPDATFVIVGVTNGPGFHPNPCLASQLRWVRRHHRWLGGYALTTYPTAADIAAYGAKGPYDASTPRGRLQNAAAAEATFNINTIAHVKMAVPMLWVDVEPYPFWPWSRSHAANRAVVRAVIKRYREADHRVGIYTYLNGWHQVVGNWNLPSIPTWTTVGQLHQHQARLSCTHGPSGGPAWIAQWYTVNQDFDLRCPTAPSMAEVFTAPPG
jgi:hypothetical protein